MKIENRQQFLIVLVVGAAALLVGNSLIYEPLAKWWSARSQKITELRKQVNDGKHLVDRENGVRRQWEQMRTNTLPNNTSLAEQQVLKAFDNWSRASGATITGIMPQWKNDSEEYMTLNCRIEASGNLGTLSQFLYDVEKDPMALKLDSVELSAHDTTGQQLTLGLQISGLVLASQQKR
jgi:Tfp pilus assembly protein PilO